VGKRWLLAIVFGLLVVAGGCPKSIGVHQVADPGAAASWKLSSLESGGLSQRTQQTLRRLNIDGLLPQHAEAVNGKLLELAIKEPLGEYLFALAEIHYALARKAEHHGSGEAVFRYYLSAGYAYHFLFYSHDEASAPQATERHAGTNPFDPRHRLACDIYNVGLSKCIRAAQSVGRLDPRHQLQMPTPSGEFTLSVEHYGFCWQPEEFGPLQFCSDFEVFGLENQYRTFGLGVPLIGRRAQVSQPAPSHAFYPKDLCFPVTAFFRFESNLADLAACRAGRLELYDPLRIQSVKVAGKDVALETDLTTPLAYFMSHTDLNGVALQGFLRADSDRGKAGIYFFEPYQPGKIPVLLTHGLMSSPLIWTVMFNDLRADPVLRDRFQFWFVLYPTANSYLATAADLRHELASLRNTFDPQRQDIALDDMVLIGHSMGGLVDKLLTQSSGEEFWQLVTDHPITQVKGSSEALDELERVFFFERQPAVKRIVFLGTPHRGSKLSLPTAFLLDGFLKESDRLTEAGREVVRSNPQLWPTLAKNPSEARLPTSLDLLRPGAPALKMLAKRGPPPGVHYHSVVGVLYGEGKTGNDGFVAYESAHIDGVESELVVPAGHRELHDHPQAVLEINRILREHLEEFARFEVR
jgi:pimeloyl-ACP methyl ester carboxylesterase